jgi:hypothetical protein
LEILQASDIPMVLTVVAYLSISQEASYRITAASLCSCRFSTINKNSTHTERVVVRLFQMSTTIDRDESMNRIQTRWTSRLDAWGTLFLNLIESVWGAGEPSVAPQVKAQAPGFCRIMLGGLEVTALLDGTHPFPIDTVVAGVSKTEIARDLRSDFPQQPDASERNRAGEQA